jgi:hypothetical protein
MADLNGRWQAGGGRSIILEREIEDQKQMGKRKKGDKGGIAANRFVSQPLFGAVWVCAGLCRRSDRMQTKRRLANDSKPRRQPNRPTVDEKKATKIRTHRTQKGGDLLASGHRLCLPRFSAESQLHATWVDGAGKLELGRTKAQENQERPTLSTCI